MYTSTVNNSFKFLGRVASLLLDTNCKRSTTRLVLASLMLAVFGTVFANSASAQCLTSSANQTLVLGPGVHSVTSQSPNASYTASLCGYWIVDIQVPSNSSGIGPDLNSFHIFANTTMNGPIGPPVQSQCKYSEYTYVYRKLPGETNFTLVGGGQIAAKWDSTNLFPCYIGPTFFYIPIPTLNPPASGTAVYRVLTRVKSQGQNVPVTVVAVHDSPPPQI